MLMRIGLTLIETAELLIPKSKQAISIFHDLDI